MWAAIKQKIIQIDKAAGVQIHFAAQHTPLISALSLTVQKNTLYKENLLHPCEKIAEFRLSKQLPLSLVFTGKGIVTRKMNGPSNTHSFTEAFPQINPAEFYIQATDFTSFCFITVIKKDLADSIINEFQRNGFHVLGFSLGFSVVDVVLPFLPTSTLITGPYKVNVLDKKITDFETKKDDDETTEYTLSAQYIPSSHILCYAAAARLIADDITSLPDIPQMAIAKNREEFRYKKFFYATGLAAIGLIFLLLLVNFVVYSHYLTKNNELEMEQTLTKTTGDNAESLNQEVAKKEELIKELGWLKQQKTSFFADRFAGLVPSELWLTTLEFNPIKKSFMSDDNLIHFKNDTVLIAGTCTEAGQINTFINNIKTLDQVKNVVLKNYSYKKEDDEGSFSLEIVTK